MKPNQLLPKIEETIQSLNPENLSEDRKKILQPLADYIQSRVNEGEEIRLNFICTHNSRRSHLAQAWAQAMASRFAVPGVFCYSGGTEATALHPLAAEALKEAGFEISALSEGKNPVYSISFADNAHPVIGFSKTYDHAFNPRSHFATVMTCSEADAGCPFIAGADVRIPITYEDPKAFDGSAQQAARYRERSLQIATELLIVFSKIKI